MDDFKTNQRLGIKAPRSTLLPPYLELNDYYIDYVDSIDAVFGPLVDDKISIISKIRNMWLQNPTTEVSAQAHTIVDNSDWSAPERAIVVKQVNMLGLRLQNAGVVSDDAYQTLARFIGMYWFGKGTQAFIDFINYCLGSDLTVTVLWTQDYVNFLAEGDINIGTAIWDGGTWYPTTSVLLLANESLQGIDVATLQAFFYEVANYNLVLQSVQAILPMPIVNASGIADIVAIGMIASNKIVITN